MVKKNRNKFEFYIFSSLCIMLFPLIFLGLYAFNKYLESKLDLLFEKFGVNSTIKLIFFGGIKGIGRILGSSFE